MSVKYSWSRQNGAAVPPVRFMSIEPAEDYYKGMPLKLKEKGIVEPTDGDPEYICMAQYDPDAEIQPLEIPVQEVFPDVIYEKINNDGTTEEVRFGSRGGGVGIKTVNGQKPDANGNVEVTAGVQSDMYETDPESMAFVKNNPLEDAFGIKTVGFSGNDSDIIDGETGILAGKYWAWISDDTPSYSDLYGQEMIFVLDDFSRKILLGEGNLVDYSETNEMPGVGITDDTGWYVGVVAHEETKIPYTETFTFPKPGIWMRYNTSNGKAKNYIKSISYRTKVKKLKSEMVPSHTHKWDDIEDAICYDRSTSGPLNLVFDGNLDGRETFAPGGDQIMVKLSDAVLTVDDLIGGTVIYEGDGQETQIELTNENVVDMSAESGLPALMVGFDGVMVIYGDLSAMGLPLTPGVWVAYAEDVILVKSISNPNATIITGELKKIDNKYIDAEWIATTTEVKGDVPFLEGTIDSRDTMNGTPGAALNVGEKYLVVWDGVEYVCKANDYGELFGGSPGDAIGIGDLMIIAGQGGAGEPFFIFYVEDGVERFTIAAAVEGEHTFAVYELVETTALLPNKFIDAEWMATSGQEQFEGEIVSNRTIQSASIGGGSNLAGYASNYDLIKEGDGLRVVWNGKDYNVTVKAATISAYGYTIDILYAGNYGAVLSHQGMSSSVAVTGEPFSISFGQTNIQTGEFEHILDVSVATEEATGVENIISIYAESYIVPLPEKFMPELTQVILISPSGKKFKTTVGDDGVLITTEV